MVYEFSELLKNSFKPVVFRIPGTDHYVISYYKLGHNSLKYSLERVVLNENDPDSFRNFLNDTKIDKLILTLRNPFERFCAGAKEIALYRSEEKYNISLSVHGFFVNEMMVGDKPVKFGDDHTYHYGLLQKLHSAEFWKDFIASRLKEDFLDLHKGPQDVDVHIRPYIVFYRELFAVISDKIDCEIVDVSCMTYYFGSKYGLFVPVNHGSTLSKLIDYVIINELCLNTTALKLSIPILFHEHLHHEYFKKSDKMFELPVPIERIGGDMDDLSFGVQQVYMSNAETYKNLKMFWINNER